MVIFVLWFIRKKPSFWRLPFSEPILLHKKNRKKLVLFKITPRPMGPPTPSSPILCNTICHGWCSWMSWVTNRKEKWCWRHYTGEGVHLFGVGLCTTALSGVRISVIGSLGDVGCLRLATEKRSGVKGTPLVVVYVYSV